MFAFYLAVLFGSLESNMSSQEMKATGLAKLSTQEKMALEAWIQNNYSKKLIVQNEKKEPILEENLKNGKFIRLSDDSLWEISPSDTPITQGWITAVEITISKSNDSDYPYLLTNSLTGSSVKAKKITHVIGK